MNQEWKVYLDSQDNLDFTLSRSGWQGDYVDPNTFLEIFVSGGGNNDTGWGSPEYDRLRRESPGDRGTGGPFASTSAWTRS